MMENRKSIDLNVVASPQGVVSAIEQVSTKICESVGMDYQDCVAALLSAAVHIALLNSGHTKDEVVEDLESCMADTADLVEEMFGVGTK